MKSRKSRSGGARLGPSRLGIAFVLLLAAAAGVFGVSRLVAQSATPAATGPEATIDSLTAQVAEAGWTKMDHEMSGSPGFQMPPAMMPGMPQNDDERLAVTVTVTNDSAGTRPMRPGEEFTLRAGEEGEPRAPQSHTFGELPRLSPNHSVTGILFFDLTPAELADSPSWVEWTHGDSTRRLIIPLDGADSGPNHSPDHHG